MKKIVFPAMVLFILAGPACAWADVTKESFTRFGGFNGSGAYEGTTVTRIQGSKQSETSNIKFTGALLSRVAGTSNTAVITRVDKGVVWMLDTKKKTCAEYPLEGFGPGEQADDDMPADGEYGEEAPEVRVTKNEFSVRKTGASETINGFACEEYLVTWLMEFQDVQTGEKTLNTMKTSLWTTPETAAIKKLNSEETAFSRAYLKKLGIDVSPNDMKQFGMESFAMMGGAPESALEKGFADFKKEMGKVKGCPIRTVVSWSAANDQAGEAVQEQEKISLPSGAKDLMGGLGGMVSGAVSRKMTGKASPEADAPFFSSTTEIRSISTDPIPAQTFEVPAGYKKQR